MLRNNNPRRNNMTPQELEQHKQLVEQHQQWLKHPVTNEMLKVLNNHKDKFTRTLLDGVMVGTNEKEQENCRSGIKTCSALEKAFTDSETFIRLIKQPTK